MSHARQPLLLQRAAKLLLCHVPRHQGQSGQCHLGLLLLQVQRR
jgi:hypothetical protein